LRQVADPGERRGVLRARRLAEQRDLPFGRRQQAHGQREQRGLARAVRPDQADDRA
jgi:hypothetical protein